MLNTPFYHDLLRRYIVAFGSLFKTVTIVRTDSNGVETQRIVVPIGYGPKDRWLTRLVQDPEFLQGVSQTVPRLAYEITGISYDATRKLQTLNQLTFPTTDNTKAAQIYVPVPMLLSFNLSVLIKQPEDGFQIIEQILPFFTPDLAISMTTVGGIQERIPVTLQNVSMTDNYEGDFEKRRAVIWSIDFGMKVNFYGPRREKGIVTEVLVDIYNTGIDDLDALTQLETENNLLFETEDALGHLLDESTANTFIELGRVARIDVTPTTTTITETEGDILRTRTTATDEIL